MGLLEWLARGCRASNQPENDKIDIAVANIINGHPIMMNPLFEFGNQVAIRKIHSRVYEAKRHLERIKLMNKHFSEETFVKCLKKIDKALKKRELISNKLRMKSFVFFEASEFEMAVHCCNLALLFTPGDSHLIPNLHTIRALFLNALKDWESMMKDVELSLALGKKFCPLTKMKLENMREAYQKKVSKIGPKLDHETEKRRIFCEQVLFNLIGTPNAKIPSGGNYIKIVEHPIKGRTLVVTEELRAGTTVIVEEPYVSIAIRSGQWQVKCCSKCYKNTRALIACHGCVFTMYCSEECRMADYNSIHKYECPCLNYFHTIDIPDTMKLGFRAVIKAGPEFMFNLFQQTKSYRKRSPNFTKGVNPETGRYDSDSYHQIYDLISYLKDERLELMTWQCYNLAKLLHIKTTFFENVSAWNQAKFVEFIGSCFLRHSVSFPYNCLAFLDDPRARKTKGRGSTKLNNQVNPNGFTGVYSLASLISHSCDPNAFPVYLENGKIAIVTTRKLVAKEEITIAYNYEFSTDKLNVRAPRLMHEFHFKCKCIPCVDKWPTLDQIGTQVQHLCPNCTKKFSYEQTAKFKKCVLNRQGETNDIGTCGNCNEEFSIPILKEEASKYDNMLKRAKELMTEDNPVDAVTLILECIEFFQAKYLPPSLPLIIAQTSLICAYDSITANTRE